VYYCKPCFVKQPRVLRNRFPIYVTFGVNISELIGHRMAVWFG